MRRSISWVACGALVLGMSVSVWAATSNTGNNPCFLVLQVCSNAHIDWDSNVIDIGVDVGADGSVDHWLSGDTSVTGLWSTTKGIDGFNTNNVVADQWRTIILNLDRYAGQQAKITIVDNSDSHYVAINAIRLNYADGTMVANGVPNGLFEDSPALSGWTVTAGNLTASDLIVDDNGVLPYTSKYLATTTSGTATIESDAFTLTPVSSFIYGTFSGEASSRFDNPGFRGSDNGNYVYVDLGTASADPDGQFTDGQDIPLTGYYWQDADGAMEVAVINTSGYEGRRAQFVAVDSSGVSFVGMDAIRMNWDNSVIRNGGFEEGFEAGYPEGFEGTSARTLGTHPTGSLPGWTLATGLDGNDDPDANFAFFGSPGDFARSGRAYVGSRKFVDPADGSSVDDDGLAGAELRSAIFTIQPIPSAGSSVFLSFNSAQVSSRAAAVDSETGIAEFSGIHLQIDVDNDGTFDGSGDFVYENENSGMSWNREQRGEVDEWHYPEYRFYIDPAHQGKQGRILVAELLPGSWGWMAVDDFYFWDGTSADLAFPNSDFEMGNLTGWSEDAVFEMQNFGTWLSDIPENTGGDAGHNVLNDVLSWVDGNYAADSNESGDGNLGDLVSDPFPIPVGATLVQEWSIF